MSKATLYQILIFQAEATHSESEMEITKTDTFFNGHNFLWSNPTHFTSQVPTEGKAHASLNFHLLPMFQQYFSLP